MNEYAFYFFFGQFLGSFESGQLRFLCLTFNFFVYAFWAGYGLENWISLVMRNDLNHLPIIRCSIFIFHI